jgi:hypothetical protein
MAVNTQELFDIFITVKYSNTRYTNQSGIITDLKDLFNNLIINNESLTSGQIDQLIAKITKGKSRSLLINHADEGILNLLTNHHLLSTIQVCTLLDNLVLSKSKRKMQWKWIDNLKAKNYIFTAGQLQQIKTLGYIDKKIKKLQKFATDNNDENMTKLYTVCKKPVVSANEIKKICETYNLIPDNNCLHYLLKNLRMHSGAITNELDILYTNKFVPNDESIDVILQTYYKPNPDEIIEEFILQGAVLNDGHIKQIYKSEKYISWEVLYKLTKLCVKYTVMPTEAEFKIIIAPSLLTQDHGTHDAIFRKNIISIFLDTYHLKKCVTIYVKKEMKRHLVC